MAANAVRQALSGEGGRGAKLTSVTAVLGTGRTGRAYSNTGHDCTSGRVLDIRVIGSFPHITVAPLARGLGHHPPESTTVTAILLRVDAINGNLCLNGVTTSPITPAFNSTVLEIG